MDRSDSISRALSALKYIEEQHLKFISQFSTSKETRTGSISSTSGMLSIVCFGTPIQCAARPVLGTDESVAYEYQFSVESPGHEVQLVGMYLTRGGHIMSPTMQGSRVCDFNNQHIHDRVGDLVANAMLRSSFFSPRI